MALLVWQRCAVCCITTPATVIEHQYSDQAAYALQGLPKQSAVVSTEKPIAAHAAAPPLPEVLVRLNFPHSGLSHYKSSIKSSGAMLWQGLTFVAVCIMSLKMLPTTTAPMSLMC